MNAICEEIIADCPDLALRFQAIGLICQAAKESGIVARALALRE